MMISTIVSVFITVFLNSIYWNGKQILFLTFWMSIELRIERMNVKDGRNGDGNEKNEITARGHGTFQHFSTKELLFSLITERLYCPFAKKRNFPLWFVVIILRAFCDGFFSIQFHYSHGSWIMVRVNCTLKSIYHCCYNFSLKTWFHCCVGDLYKTLLSIYFHFLTK